MRVAAVGLFLITFAITIWAIRVPESTDQPSPPAVAPVAVEEPIRLAEGNTQPGQHFRLPEGCHVVSFRAEVSDRIRPGTKVDLLLIPRGWIPEPPKLVLSGVFVVPVSYIGVLNEDTGEAIEADTYVNLAVTSDQMEQLAAADVRGSFRIVPAK
jgi:hypothetical protein